MPSALNLLFLFYTFLCPCFFFNVNFPYVNCFLDFFFPYVNFFNCFGTVQGVQPLLNGVLDYLPCPTEVSNYALDQNKSEEKVQLMISCT